MLPWLVLKFDTAQEAALFKLLADRALATSLLGRSSVLHVLTLPKDYTLGSGNQEIPMLPPPDASAAAGGQSRRTGAGNIAAHPLQPAPAPAATSEGFSIAAAVAAANPPIPLDLLLQCQRNRGPVSYTHLTLPTICSV